MDIADISRPFDKLPRRM